MLVNPDTTPKIQSSASEQALCLTEALDYVCKQARHRFHVPFHAGVDWTGSSIGPTNASLFQRDLTELPSLDILGSPAGVLLDSQNQVAQAFGSRYCYFLINGASVGIMAAILASGACEKSPVLVARNCHRAVVHGLILTGASVEWVLPEYLADWGLWGGITPHVLAEKLQESPEIKTVIITHPTYEGIPSDVNALAAICKAHKAKLIVDEAHGALWNLSDRFPQSAIAAGADAVIHSLHKSGGSLTQTASLHLPYDSQFEPTLVQQALNLLQTTSPSYPLLANIEQTCACIASHAGTQRLNMHLDRILDLRTWIANHLQNIQVLSPLPNQEVCQIYLRSDFCTGEDLGELLEETYDIAYESVTPYGVLLNANIGLPNEAFEALKAALTSINRSLAQNPKISAPLAHFERPQMQTTCREAFFAPGELISKADAVGRISKQVLASCPPGIPILIPGEVIQDTNLDNLPDYVMVMTD